MKIIYTLAIALLLTGCSLLAPKFDNVEYAQFTHLGTHADFLFNECGDNAATSERLEKMDFRSASLKKYASNIPNNGELIKIITIIDNDVQEMIDKGDMSKTFCELKTEQLIIKINRTLESIGNLN